VVSHGPCIDRGAKFGLDENVIVASGWDSSINLWDLRFSLVAWEGAWLFFQPGGQRTAQKFISWMILQEFTISNAATIGS